MMSKPLNLRTPNDCGPNGTHDYNSETLMLAAAVFPSLFVHHMHLYLCIKLLLCVCVVALVMFMQSFVRLSRLCLCGDFLET